MADEWGGESGVDVRAYVGVVWRRKWWVVGVTALFVGGGLVAAGDGEVSAFRSSARVLVKPIRANPLEGPARVDQAVDLDTESQILGSTAVARLAAAALGSGEAPDVLAARVTTTVSADTQILGVAYRAATPADAQAGAQAFADAYLAYKTGEAAGAVATVTGALTTRVGDLEAQLLVVNAALSTNAPGTPNFTQAEANRDVLSSQIALLRNQIASYSAVDLDPGSVIQPAQTAVPITPSHLPVPLAGAVGFLAGLALAFLRERFDDRLHRPDAAQTLLGIPVLAAIPHRSRRQRRHPIADPRSADAEAYQRLATTIAATTTDGTNTVLITSPSAGDGKTTIAANLAIALARTHRTALVSADLRLPTLQRIFPATGPTLTDLLGGTATAEEIATHPAQHPNLTVYPSSATTAHPAQQLQSAAMTLFLHHLRATHDIVIIDAPPILPVADTLTLAAYADTTLLITRQHTTTQKALQNATQQLTQTGHPPTATITNHTHQPTTGHKYYRHPARRRMHWPFGNREVAELVPFGPAAAPVGSWQPARVGRETLLPTGSNGRAVR